MSRCRTLLLWLCCALLVLGGRRAGAGAACGAGTAGDAPSCCADHCHCGERTGSASCCCERGEHPAPPPSVPAPDAERAMLPDPEWPPLPAAPPPPAVAVHGARTPGLPIGLLPRVSRQKALSVWRC